MSENTGRTIADWHKEYFRFVYRRCLKILRNEQDAEDIAQEVFFRLFKAEERGTVVLTEIDNEMGMLYKIAVNLCLNRLNEKKEKFVDSVQFFDNEIPSLVNNIEYMDAKMLIQAILEYESEETRSYCYMYYYERMTLDEIAKAAGKSTTWIFDKLADFKKRARRKFGGT